MKVGDLLFIRSGFTEAYRKLDKEEWEKVARRANVRGKENRQRWAGVQQSEEVKEWLYNGYFAAVAGDAPSWEAWPSLQGKFCRSPEGCERESETEG